MFSDTSRIKDNRFIPWPELPANRNGGEEAQRTEREAGEATRGTTRKPNKPNLKADMYTCARQGVRECTAVSPIPRVPVTPRRPRGSQIALPKWG